MESINTIDPRTWDWYLGTQCGLNAEWCVSAWQISDGISGDDGATFVLDSESGIETGGEGPAFYLVRRWDLHEVNEGAYQSAGNATFEGDKASDPEAFDGHNDAIVTLAEFATAQDVIDWIKTREPTNPNETAESAEGCFWSAVAAAHPDIKTGDFPPDAASKFTAACTEAIATWLDANGGE